MTDTIVFFYKFKHVVLLIAIAFLLPYTIYFGIKTFIDEAHLNKPENLQKLEQEVTRANLQLKELDAKKEALISGEQIVTLKLEASGKTFLWKALMEQDNKNLQEQVANITKQINELTQQKIKSHQNSLKENEEYAKQLNKLKEKVEFKKFLISLIAGFLALLIGALLRIPSIGSGLIWGGLISLSMGYSFYWGLMTNLIKFISLIFILLIIIFISVISFKRSRNISE